MFSFFGAPRGHSVLSKFSGHAPNQDAYGKAAAEKARDLSKSEVKCSSKSASSDSYGSSPKIGAVEATKVAPPTPVSPRRIISLDRANSPDAAFLLGQDFD